MIRTACLTLAAIAALALPAHAAPLAQGEWAGSVRLGFDAPVSGDVHGGADAPIADLGPLNPALAGVAAELRIEARSFDDIYGEAAVIEVEAARGIGGGREIFGAVRHISSDDGTVQVGGAFVPALSTTLPVFGRFDGYTATSLEAGVRQYFGEAALQPYVAGRLGAAVIDEINATFTIPDAAITLPNARFYEGSTVLTVGADVGVSYAVNDRLSVGGEIGFRYVSAPEDDDSSIAGLGLASINDEGDRISIPITVRLRLRF